MEDAESAEEERPINLPVMGRHGNQEKSWLAYETSKAVLQPAQQK